MFLGITNYLSFVIAILVFLALPEGTMVGRATVGQAALTQAAS